MADTPLPTVLVTNDDGIDSPGLHAMVAACTAHARVIVVAPASDQSGVSRSITLGRMLEVEERDVPGAEAALAIGGTPTDCVRMAVLGLAGLRPDMVVSGANRGLNVGDDVAYSGTVSAAFDAAMNGMPAIAVSQQSRAREMGYPRSTDFAYDVAAQFVEGLVPRVLAAVGSLPAGLVVNVNVPGVPIGEIAGVEVGSLGRRIYRDKLELEREVDGRRHFRIYGDDPEHHADEVGTDIAAIGRSCIAVTPLRFAVHDAAAVDAVSGWDLDSLLV